jgi:hypothetical protein
MARFPTHLQPHPRRPRRGFALMDAVIAGVLLAIGMIAVLSVGGQAMTMQMRGEIDVRASAALDSLLSGVLTEGPEDYEELYPLNGRFEDGSGFEDFEFAVTIERGGAGIPAHITARVRHEDGKEYEIETSIAELRGEEPHPDRLPAEPIDREARYAQRQQAREGQSSSTGTAP